jgi:hypothetical protein
MFNPSTIKDVEKFERRLFYNPSQEQESDLE